MRFNTAISIGNTKEAALYFDHVIPLYLAAEYIPEFLKGTNDLVNMPFDLMPQHLRQTPNFTDRWVAVNEAFLQCMFIHLDARYGKSTTLEDVTSDDWQTVAQAATKYYAFLRPRRTAMQKLTMFR